MNEYEIVTSIVHLNCAFIVTGAKPNAKFHL